MAPGAGSLPRGIKGKLMNTVRADMPALPIPVERRVTALADQSVIDRFDKDAAGVRALEKGDNVITVFDVIGEDFWGEGVTAKSISRQLKAIGGAVEVQINSPGGDVFEGFAIYNALREHPYPVNVKVLGMAASAASVIAMAGDTIEVGAAAFLMIHNCWVMAVGNKTDLREVADFLAPFDAALASVYHARTGMPVGEIETMMDRETYMSGADAVSKGFATGLLPSDQVKVDASAQANDRETNAVRSMELTLVASGLSRAQARERIQKVKGAKPGAGSQDQNGTAGGTPGAATDNRAWMGEAVALLSTLKKS